MSILKKILFVSLAAMAAAKLDRHPSVVKKAKARKASGLSDVESESADATDANGPSRAKHAVSRSRRKAVRAKRAAGHDQQS